MYLRDPRACLLAEGWEETDEPILRDALRLALPPDRVTNIPNNFSGKDVFFLPPEGVSLRAVTDAVNAITIGEGVDPMILGGTWVILADKDAMPLLLNGSGYVRLAALADSDEVFRAALGIFLWYVERVKRVLVMPPDEIEATASFAAIF